SDPENDLLTLYFTQLPERGEFYQGDDPTNVIQIGKAYRRDENGNFNLRFVPDNPSDFGAGYAHFSCYVRDSGRLRSDVVVNTINVAYVTPPPVPVGPANYAAPAGVPIDVTLEATDPDNDALDYTVTALPSHGNLFLYSPYVDQYFEITAA